MHGAVVSNTEYREKISKTKEADQMKSKIFKQKIRKKGIKASVNKKAKATVTEKGKNSKNH